MVIESVVGKNSEKASDGLQDEACTMCQLAVVWLQNQLSTNETEEVILDYANQVNEFLSFIAAIAECWLFHVLKP